MEEAETLSSRLAIMTKGGKLACEGTTVKIKNDHGKNFHVELTFKPQEIKDDTMIDGYGIRAYEIQDPLLKEEAWNRS